MPLHIRLLRLNYINSIGSYLRNSLQLINRRFLHESYYDILKVPETCSSKDVRDAFINLSKKNHPDKHLNDPSMHDRFIRINEAYSVLINPLSRRAYDITLNHKRKIGEPPHRPREYNYSHHTVEKEKKTKSSSSRGSTHSSNNKSNYSTSYAEGDPFTWHYRTAKDYTKTTNTTNTANAHTAAADLNDAYYGVKGVKRISNRKVASILLLFTFFAVFVQLIVIRRSVRKSRENALERNRKLALMLAMSKEKARLYGNEYQINLLKKSLRGSFGDDDIDLKDDRNLDGKGKDSVHDNKGYPMNEEEQPVIRPAIESNIRNSKSERDESGTTDSTNKAASDSVPLLTNSDTFLTQTMIPKGQVPLSLVQKHKKNPLISPQSSNKKASNLTYAQVKNNNDHTKTAPTEILQSTSSSTSPMSNTASYPHLSELFNPPNSYISKSQINSQIPSLSSLPKNPTVHPCSTNSDSAAPTAQFRTQSHQSFSPIITSSQTESCQKCKKCKRL